MKHLNQAQIEELQELLEDDFSDLVQQYLRECESKLISMQSAYLEGNFSDFRDAAHTLKGSSSNIGAEYLQDMCRDAEERALSQSLEGVDALLANIDAEVKNVGGLLTQYLS